jgi:hypothetical protein
MRRLGCRAVTAIAIVLGLHPGDPIDPNTSPSSDGQATDASAASLPSH